MPSMLAYVDLGLFALMIAALLIMPRVPRGSVGAKILIAFFVLLGVGSPIFGVLIVFGSAQSIERLIQLLH